jgi:hypothetical protein
MTARCPLGCGWWSIPPAVERHVRNGNCAGEPWALRSSGELLIPRDDHARQRVLALLPPHLVRPVQPGDRAYRPLARDRYIRDDVIAGTVLLSPFPGIPARRWLEVAHTALRRLGPNSVREVLNRKRFVELEQTLGTAEGFVACPMCDDWLRKGGLVAHQKGNTRCRFLVAHRAVETAWQQGWRDPWSLRSHVPLLWADLSSSRWRRWVRLVEYPQWTAVLIAPHAGSERGASGPARRRRAVA